MNRFGEQRGSDIAQATITDAMPRSPVSPSFVDMRDAIALAIDDRYHDSSSPDETGTIPSGTVYVLTHLWSGAGESFDLTATDTR